MICESGRFEYDENLEDYIDFKTYGQDKIGRETGAFTSKGYLLYHGYNMEIQSVLNKNIGLKIKKLQEPQELKLYMPLKAITYQDENDYGDLYQVDYEIDVYPEELAEFEDEIQTAVINHRLDSEKHGMMDYYDEPDTVNAKVQKYLFDVEVIDGELMGVAVLTLNVPLNQEELMKIKEAIEGQSSSKYVLSDILVCGECSHPYRRQTWSRNGNLTPVWRCESRLLNGTKNCKHSATLKEKPLQEAIMTAVNSVVENQREVVGAFRENVIRVIGSYTTKNIKTEFDEEIDKLQKQLLALIEENAKQGAVNENFDEQYKKIAEEMQALKIEKLKQAREQRLADEYGQRVEGMDSCLGRVSCRVGEFDEDLIRRLILRIKVISESRIEIHFKYGIILEQEVVFYED